jgi:hypothetical protein
MLLVLTFVPISSQHLVGRSIEGGPSSSPPGCASGLGGCFHESSDWAREEPVEADCTTWLDGHLDLLDCNDITATPRGHIR